MVIFESKSNPLGTGNLQTIKVICEPTTGFGRRHLPALYNFDLSIWGQPWFSDYSFERPTHSDRNTLKLYKRLAMAGALPNAIHACGLKWFFPAHFPSCVILFLTSSNFLCPDVGKQTKLFKIINHFYVKSLQNKTWSISFKIRHFVQQSSQKKK